MSSIITDLGVNLAANYIYDRLKKIPLIQTKFGTVRVIFQLITKLYDLPSYDFGNTELNRVLRMLESRESQIESENVIYHYNVDWEFVDECSIPIDSWMGDVQIINDNGEPVSINSESEIAARCVQGFRIRIYSSSSGIELTALLDNGYKILDDIKTKIKRNSLLKIKQEVVAIAIISDNEANDKLLSKLKKKVKEEEVINRVKLSTISKNLTQLVIYVRDRYEIDLINNAIKSWWPL